MSVKLKLICVFLILLCFYGCKNDVNAEYIAPGFSLNNLSGEAFSLDQFAGKIVLLDFWATWCPPCRESIPELIDIQKRYKDEGVVILGISVDDPKQANNNYLRSFKKKYKINYTVLRSNDRILYDYFGNRQMNIPTMFIIDREGIIAGRLVGFQAGAVEKSLKKLLR